MTKLVWIVRGGLELVRMKQIPLGQDKFALVDDEDYDYLMQWNWHLKTPKNNENTCYATRKDGNKSIKMHREIMKFPLSRIDHKDRNGLNNQKDNLRKCTHAQNMRNRRKKSGCSSQFKGVTWCKELQKWKGKITFDGKIIHIGYFDNEIDAALAYNVKAIELFGQFALLNEIP